MKFPLFPILIIILTAASCSVNQEIYLDRDGSGKVTGRVLMDDFYLNTLRDLTDLNSAAEGELSPMDPSSITKELSRNPLFRNVLVTGSDAGLYQGGLEFRNVEELFYTDRGVASTVISFERRDMRSTLEIRINSENFQELFRLFPVLQDPGFQYFLPEPAISRNEYMEMLHFLFEDQFGGSETELQTRIEEASLNLTIHTGGKILSYQGGELRGDRELKIEIPLLDLLLHREELFYSVSY